MSIVVVYLAIQKKAEPLQNILFVIGHSMWSHLLSSEHLSKVIRIEVASLVNPGTVSPNVDSALHSLLVKLHFFSAATHFFLGASPWPRHCVFRAEHVDVFAQAEVVVAGSAELPLVVKHIWVGYIHAPLIRLKVRTDVSLPTSILIPFLFTGSTIGINL